MSELFFEGYSQYQLEAMKIPSEARGKCLKQIVEYTHCAHKAGPSRIMFSHACEDQKFRFDLCHQKSVNYSSTSSVATMMYANPSAFRAKGVSPTYEDFFSTPTPLNINR